MRWIDHRADVVDHLGEIGEPLSNPLIVREDGNDRENIGAGFDSMRGQLLPRHGQEVDDRLDPLVFLVGMLDPKLRIAEIAIRRKPHIVELNFVEAHLRRLDTQIDIRLPKLLMIRIHPGGPVGASPDVTAGRPNRQVGEVFCHDRDH